MPKKMKYPKWLCPKCGTDTVVPAIIGMPGPDLMDLARDGHVILWGCTLDGSEPENPVQCTRCSWPGEIHSGNLFPALTKITPAVINDCRERISPDGHLVGSLGEIFAAAELGLSLTPPSNKGFDAVDSQGNKVEIKTTTGKSINLSASGTEATRLVVVVLDKTGEASIAFDGPAQAVWNVAGPSQKNGQRRVSLSKIGGK